jgi:hypothetical protein
MSTCRSFRYRPPLAATRLTKAAGLKHGEGRGADQGIVVESLGFQEIPAYRPVRRCPIAPTDGDTRFAQPYARRTFLALPNRYARRPVVAPPSLARRREDQRLQMPHRMAWGPTGSGQAATSASGDHVQPVRLFRQALEEHLHPVHGLARIAQVDVECRFVPDLPFGFSLPQCFGVCVAGTSAIGRSISPQRLGRFCSLQIQRTHPPPRQ